MLALDPGFAGSTAAALIGLAALGAAALVALVLLVRTVRAWRELSAGPRTLGLAPLLLLCLLLIGFAITLARSGSSS